MAYLEIWKGAVHFRCTFSSIQNLAYFSHFIQKLRLVNITKKNHIQGAPPFCPSHSVPPNTPHELSHCDRNVSELIVVVWISGESRAGDGGSAAAAGSGCIPRLSVGNTTLQCQLRMLQLKLHFNGKLFISVRFELLRCYRRLTSNYYSLFKFCVVRVVELIPSKYN